jgi:hypothetical protein
VYLYVPWVYRDCVTSQTGGSTVGGKLVLGKLVTQNSDDSANSSSNGRKRRPCWRRLGSAADDRRGNMRADRWPVLSVVMLCFTARCRRRVGALRQGRIRPAVHQDPRRSGSKKRQIHRLYTVHRSSTFCFFLTGMALLSQQEGVLAGKKFPRLVRDVIPRLHQFSNDVSLAES